MPRNGSGVYSLPAGYEATTGQTAEATQHNSPLEDLKDDANTARPVVAGGTGQTTASGARDEFDIDAKVLSKSGAYTAVAGDRSKLIRGTAAYTLSLTAAATLGDGWFVDVLADGGATTIDPDGAETIDGSATLVVADGQSVRVRCNGTAFYTQFLTTKMLTDALRIQDATDQTKEVDFDVSAIATATTRTVTMPDADVDLGSFAASTDIVGQQTIWVPANAMTPTTTNGAASSTEELATNDVMLAKLDFDDSTAEYACFQVQMPKGWNESTLIAQFVWKCGVTSGDVIWGIQAVAFADDDALDTAFGTAQEVTDTAGGAADDCMISAETSAMTVAGSPAAEEFVVFKVYRDAADGSDTLTGDAELLGVKIHYTTDAATDS